MRHNRFNHVRLKDTGGHRFRNCRPKQNGSHEFCDGCPDQRLPRTHGARTYCGGNNIATIAETIYKSETQRERHCNMEERISHIHPNVMLRTPEDNSYWQARSIIKTDLFYRYTRPLLDPNGGKNSGRSLTTAMSRPPVKATLPDCTTMTRSAIDSISSVE